MKHMSSASPTPSEPSSSSGPDQADLHGDLLETRLARAEQAIDQLRSHRPDALAVISAIHDVIISGGRIYTCGNGGSAAEALHLAEELLGRFRGNRPPLPGTCLNSDPTALTCIANDFGYDQVFARQAEGLIGPKDALVVFTTSGKSANILEAIHATRRKGGRCIGFLGGNGGPARSLCHTSIVVGGEDSASIQEAHQVLLHACCEALEHLG
jgi:D-sedoheptulose 7-phosphate isomerase